MVNKWCVWTPDREFLCACDSQADADMIAEELNAKRVEKHLEILQQIEQLALWHCDEEADESDEHPEDMTAHINGLIVQLCRRPLEK